MAKDGRKEPVGCHSFEASHFTILLRNDPRSNQRKLGRPAALMGPTRLALMPLQAELPSPFLRSQERGGVLHKS